MSDNSAVRPSDNKTASANSGAFFKTIYNLWPYMWLSDRSKLKQRVLW